MVAKIAVIPGDGAGIEVTAEAVRVLQKIDDAHRLGLQFEHFDFGAERYLKTGVAMPPGQIEIFRNDYDAILFGAVGDPRVQGQVHAREILLGLRFGLDLYVNFRPCRLLDDRLSPLKGKGRKELDFVVFRENTEGMYNGIGGVFKKGTADEVAIAEEVNTRKGVERIIRAAFDWAKRNGKRRVALADKSNAIGAHELWSRVFKEVQIEYREIDAKHYYIDALAMQLVIKPEDFDVIVTTNLFGDILTDLGAGLTGGLGVAPSANLNPTSTPLFEPVHRRQGNRQPGGEPAHQRADVARARSPPIGGRARGGGSGSGRGGQDDEGSGRVAVDQGGGGRSDCTPQAGIAGIW
jgi:3-isopropylmalate dehydrogenase